MDTPTPPDHSEAIKEALFTGRKITAIKLYREQNQVGLAEAKAAVEKLETQLRAASPERFTAPRGGGCLAASAVIGLLFVVWKTHSG
jgi:hypothetical protein